MCQPTTAWKDKLKNERTRGQLNTDERLNTDALTARGGALLLLLHPPQHFPKPAIADEVQANRRSGYRSKAAQAQAQDKTSSVSVRI